MYKEVYEYIKQENKLVTISEIEKNINLPRNEITKILQQLNSKTLVYRKIMKGKAYYSISSNDGEGMNTYLVAIHNLLRHLLYVGCHNVS